jgi:hypothetical protein
MTPQLSQVESRAFRTNAPAKRGRKSYTTPDVTDVTGRTHFMVIRKVQTNKKPKKKINNNECKNCELSDNYVDILEKRADTLESLVNNLNNNVVNVNSVSKVDNSNELNSYSNLDMNSLLCLSDTLGQILCNDISNIQQASPSTTAIESIETEFIDENVMLELWNTTDILYI